MSLPTKSSSIGRWLSKSPSPPARPRATRSRGFADDCGAEWHKDTLGWVDPEAQAVHTGAGQSVDYDALLIAVGAREIEPFEHVRTFNAAEADATYQGVLQDIEGGYSGSIAFILPVGPAWPLPIYELALMTAEPADSMGIEGLEIALITPETRPLAIFGEGATVAVGERLQRAGVDLYCSALASISLAQR